MKKLIRWQELELMDLWDIFLNIWNYQVFAVDGNGVSFGKIVAGIVLLVGGAILSRNVANRIERRFLVRMDIDASLRYNLRAIIFYFLLIFVALFVLRLLNIPLTVFAVVGGALAIGIGFGSQNIVNNFISGLILMVERPIRVGDFIEINDLAGTVEQIGARSTRVKSSSNTQIIVPNSAFLEKNIINWTLSDNLVRYKISIDVAYGSAIEKVMTVLKGAAIDNAGVARYPVPVVVLADFTEKGMKFDLFYWSHMDGSKMQIVIASEIRTEICARFKKEGLIISHSQRATVFEMAKPLDVQVTHVNNP